MDIARKLEPYESVGAPCTICWNSVGTHLLLDKCLVCIGCLRIIEKLRKEL